MSNSSKSGFIQVASSHGVATLTFGHPASNSFPKTLLNELTQTLNQLSKQEDIHVIVLQSEGEKSFCAGASFEELLAINTLDEGIAFFSGFAHVINAMRTCPKIIIGRIQGKAVGGGVGIIAACDYAYALDQASVKLSELTIGIGPFVIEPAVSRKIGKTAMSELTLAAQEWKSAEWAKQKGLYAALFDTPSALDQAVSQLATQLANYNPNALLELKKILWEDTSHWETLLIERAAISGQLVLSDFSKQALQSFKK